MDNAIGTIPVDPSDDARDGGGNSNRSETGSGTTDPNSHTPVGVRLATTAPTTCDARKIAATALDIWITRCREFSHIPTA